MCQPMDPPMYQPRCTAHQVLTQQRMFAKDYGALTHVMSALALVAAVPASGAVRAAGDRGSGGMLPFRMPSVMGARDALPGPASAGSSTSIKQCAADTGATCGTLHAHGVWRHVVRKDPDPACKPTPTVSTLTGDGRAVGCAANDHGHRAQCVQGGRGQRGEDFRWRARRRRPWRRRHRGGTCCKQRRARQR